MMPNGGISHLALVASDLDRSRKFYDTVLSFIGHSAVEVPQSTQIAMKTRLLAWASDVGSVTLRPAKPESASKKHDRDAPGVNHIAFNASSRAEVDELYGLLQRIGATILDAPSEYPYFPGYYAIYFSDPDGVKIEFVHWPQS